MNTETLTQIVVAIAAFVAVDRWRFVVCVVLPVLFQFDTVAETMARYRDWTAR